MRGLEGPQGAGEVARANVDGLLEPIPHKGDEATAAGRVQHGQVSDLGSQGVTLPRGTRTRAGTSANHVRRREGGGCRGMGLH